MPGRRPKDARESSGRRPGVAREVPWSYPGAAQELPGSYPGGAREGTGEAPEKGLSRRFLSFGGRRRTQRKQGDYTRGCLTLSAKAVELPRVFDDFTDERFSLTGAMVLHSFAKPPRLCTKCVFTAPVHKNERRSVENGSGTRVLTLKCVFSPRLCNKPGPRRFQLMRKLQRAGFKIVVSIH